MFRADVFDVRCYIIYYYIIYYYIIYYILYIYIYIYYYIIYYIIIHILLLYIIILYLLFFLSFLLLSTFPIYSSSSSVLLPFPSSSFPYSSSIHLLLPSPAPPNHSRNTCRYLHILIYILSISHSRLQIFDPACFIGVDG